MKNTLPLPLRDIKDFPKEGIIFKDISPLLADPVAMKSLIKNMALTWGGKVDRIGGFDARGFIFASALAYELGLPLFMLRKKGKLPSACVSSSYNLEYGSATLEMHTDAVMPGEKVLLVDDLLATGGTALAGCKLVEGVGGVVAGLHFVVSLSDLSGEKKLSSYDVHSLVRV